MFQCFWNICSIHTTQLEQINNLAQILHPHTMEFLENKDLNSLWCEAGTDTAAEQRRAAPAWSPLYRGCTALAPAASPWKSRGRKSVTMNAHFYSRHNQGRVLTKEGRPVIHPANSEGTWGAFTTQQHTLTFPNKAVFTSERAIP